MEKKLQKTRARPHTHTHTHKTEISADEKQTKKHNPTTVIITGKKFHVHHKLVLTVVDGKFCSCHKYFIAKILCMWSSSQRGKNIGDMSQKPKRPQILLSGSIIHA
jgi:hypothetical protein